MYPEFTIHGFYFPPEMFLEAFRTVVYTLDSGTFFEVYSYRSTVFRLNRLTSGRM